MPNVKRCFAHLHVQIISSTGSTLVLLISFSYLFHSVRGEMAVGHIRAHGEWKKEYFRAWLDLEDSCISLRKLAVTFNQNRQLGVRTEMSPKLGQTLCTCEKNIDRSSDLHQFVCHRWKKILLVGCTFNIHLNNLHNYMFLYCCCKQQL